jgi:hypothetical protein
MLDGGPTRWPNEAANKRGVNGNTTGWGPDREAPKCVCAIGAGETKNVKYEIMHNTMPSIAELLRSRQATLISHSFLKSEKRPKSSIFTETQTTTLSYKPTDKTLSAVHRCCIYMYP